MATKKDELEEGKAPAFALPRCPETVGALAPVPNDVRKQWEKNFAEELEEAKRDFPDNPLQQLEAALREANRIFRVKEPASHEDAHAIPDWQVMRRAEVEYSDLPEHARKQVRAEFGRESGRYVEVYAIDGRQYFFAVPEEATKPRSREAAKPVEAKG